MLRKVINIIIAILLVSSTSGITVYKHYCGNTLLKSSIIVAPKSCCDGTCNKCRNEVKQIKVHDNFLAQQISIIKSATELKPLFPIYNFALVNINPVFNTYVVENQEKFNSYFLALEPGVCPLMLTGALRL